MQKPSIPVPSVFAQDPTNVEAVAAALADPISEAPHLHWAALIDTSLHSGPSPWMPDDAEVINCYQPVGELAGLAAVAPCLLPLPVTRAGRASFEDLARRASGLPALSIVGSRIDLPALARHWAPLHQVHTQDGAPLLLRFADTRILPLLAGTLQPAQWQSWAQPLAHWFYVDRHGQLARCALPDGETTNSAAAITLSDEQFAAFMDGAEPDMLYARLARTLPKKVPGTLSPSAAWHNIRIAARFCHKHRITHFDDMCEITSRACITDGRYLSDLGLLEILINRSWREGELARALGS